MGAPPPYGTLSSSIPAARWIATAARACSETPPVVPIDSQVVRAAHPNARPGDQCHRRRAKPGDGREVPRRVARGASADRGDDHVAGGAEQEDVAVRPGVQHMLGGDRARGTTAVVHDDGLPQALAEFLRHAAG
jgi:hypothetical protein